MFNQKDYDNMMVNGMRMSGVSEVYSNNGAWLYWNGHYYCDNDGTSYAYVFGDKFEGNIDDVYRRAVALAVLIAIKEHGIKADIAKAFTHSMMYKANREIFDENNKRELSNLLDVVCRWYAGQVRAAEKIGKSSADAFEVINFETVYTMYVKRAESDSMKEPFTLDVMRRTMEELGYKTRFNTITHSNEYTLNGVQVVGDSVVVQITSYLLGCGTVTNVVEGRVTEYLSEIARENKYNPVLEMLNGIEWDGVDRLGNIYHYLGIEEDDLSKVLVYKWFLQGVALLHNVLGASQSADGVLVLNGEQGCGKSTFFEHFAIRQDWFLNGAVFDAKDKDVRIRITSKWICELGELEATFSRSEVDALKAFITSPTDTDRKPYGRFDETYPRTVNLCATCNSDQFLVDPTGNRRFWTVTVKPPYERGETYAALMEIDAQQLWRQMLDEYQRADNRSTCFRLNAIEAKALDERNRAFERPEVSSAEWEIRDILTKAQAPETKSQWTWRETLVKDWIYHDESLSRAGAARVGRVLTKLGLQKHIKHGWVYYNLPFFKG